jgi:hypothetical protein
MHHNHHDQHFDGVPLPHWQQRLIDCRAAFGKAPRNFDAASERFLLVNPPWVTKLRFGDALAQLVQNKTLRKLFRTGDVVWGHIIQANVELFAPAPSVASYTYDRPGEIVFSPEPDVVVTPQQLEHVASELAGLKYAEDLDPELQSWADYLNAETTRVVGKQVPDRFSPSTSCFASTTLFRRSHLPEGVLCQPLLPIIVASRQPYFAMPLPQTFWPTSLLDWWKTGG